MFQHERVIRPGLAGLVLLCFLMPFVKVTCGGQPIASMSGIDLALGKEVEQPSMLGDQFGGQFGNFHQTIPDTTSQFYVIEDSALIDSAAVASNSTQGQQPIFTGETKSTMGGDPTAIAAVLLALVALFAAFGAGRRTILVSGISAGLAAASLLIMKFRFSGDLPTEAMEIIAIEWTAAYWISMVGSVVVAALSFKILADNPEEPQKPRLVIGSYTDSRSAQPTPH